MPAVVFAQPARKPSTMNARRIFAGSAAREGFSCPDPLPSRFFAHVPKVITAMHDLRPMTGAPASGNDMLMGLSAYSLFRLAGLVICLVSGATTLASLWFVGTS